MAEAAGQKAPSLIVALHREYDRNYCASDFATNAELQNRSNKAPYWLSVCEGQAALRCEAGEILQMALLLTPIANDEDAAIVALHLTILRERTPEETKMFRDMRAAEVFASNQLLAWLCRGGTPASFGKEGEACARRARERFMLAQGKDPDHAE